ncbi:exopolyphosphatase [Actinosynnema sp. NPDC020468]|uniref:Ppx/GppA phosphatase family protein n=1 Tax=Actinosynnema sp. NPDC020468 TaxID=3154488 RepID=UPI0034083C6E
MGVLDVGCYSASLVVVDQSILRPVVTHKTRLHLDAALTPDNRLRPDGVNQVVGAIRNAAHVLDRTDVTGFTAFATSVIRDARNAEDVLAEVRRRTGAVLHVMTGEQEARLAYTAARAWFGWTAGPLLVLDVGGGTVEIAAGEDAEPALTLSLPHGARTVTRRGEFDPTELRTRLERLPRTDHRVVGCSKVFQQLARLAGARPQREGPHLRRHLHLADLREWIPRLAAMSADERSRLPGISKHRARQSLAGALVVETLMSASGRDVVEICPWSTKEGLLLDLQRKAERGDEFCRVA